MENQEKQPIKTMTLEEYAAKISNEITPTNKKNNKPDIEEVLVALHQLIAINKKNENLKEASIFLNKIILCLFITLSFLTIRNHINKNNEYAIKCLEIINNINARDSQNEGVLVRIYKNIHSFLFSKNNNMVIENDNNKE